MENHSHCCLLAKTIISFPLVALVLDRNYIRTRCRSQHTGERGISNAPFVHQVSTRKDTSTRRPSVTSRRKPWLVISVPTLLATALILVVMWRQCIRNWLHSSAHFLVATSALRWVGIWSDTSAHMTLTPWANVYSRAISMAVITVLPKRPIWQRTFDVATMRNVTRPLVVLQYVHSKILWESSSSTAHQWSSRKRDSL